jgi:uncharacterized repeat protein (TIGR01451 family)
MKKNNKNLITIVSLLSFVFAMFGFMGPKVTLAATTPSLGLAATYTILSSTYINTSAATTINGDVGFTTGPAVAPLGSHPYYGSGAPYSTAGTDQGSALSTGLAVQGCTHTFPDTDIDLATDISHGPIGVYTPGVYCTQATRAASIGSGGITLSGAGTYIFRINGALTSADSAIVTLAGASACDVFWTPTAATTLGANTTFEGTVIDDSGITVGANTNWSGRALAFGGVVTTGNTSTITNTCAATVLPSTNTNNTITIFKQVVNDSGGTATYTDFPLFLNNNPIRAGESIRFAPGLYTVTETNLPGYQATFSGDCNASGQINHGGINTHNDVCIITNNDIGAVIVPPVPPLIDVVKVPSPLSLPAGPGGVTYTYTLRNVGTVPVTDVTMIGDSCSPIILISGDTNGDAKLNVNETWVYRCSRTLTETHTNTVVATGWANGIQTTDIAHATVVVGVPIVPPLIHVTKTPNPFTLPAGGGMVTYTKKVTNPGTVALSNVKITDDKCSAVRYISGDTNGNNKLEPTETWTYTCRINLTKTTVNTAVATGEANGLTARDFAVATVVVATAVVPKLPNTGLPPAGILWNIMILAGALILVATSVVVLKKRKV